MKSAIILVFREEKDMKQTIKQVIAPVLALLILLSSVAVYSFTVSAVTSGDFEYEVLKNGTAEITKYTGSASDLTVPTEIAGYSVTSIGKEAFYNCSTLVSITIPNSVTKISDYAFYNNKKLKNITIPNSVTIVGFGAFDNTAWYDSQMNGVVYAGKSAYKFKGEMPQNAYIALEQGIKSITDNAFAGFTKLSGISIPDSVTNIGKNAFNGCTGLSSITIPNSITSVGINAFNNTGWYNSQPDGIIYVGKVAYKYKGEMPENTSVTLQEGTKSITDSAFENNSNLKGITIADSVTNIGDSAFYNCTGLTDVTIPYSVTEIGVYSFGYYNNSGEKTKVENFTITGYADTAAEAYANENGFEFLPLNKPETEPPTTNPIDPPATETTQPPQKLIGDADGDGEVTVKDVTYIQLYLANLLSEDNIDLTVCDVDNDGEINVKDATYIQLQIANLL